MTDGTQRADEPEADAGVVEEQGAGDDQVDDDEAVRWQDYALSNAVGKFSQKVEDITTTPHTLIGYVHYIRPGLYSAHDIQGRLIRHTKDSQVGKQKVVRRHLGRG